MSEVVPDTDEQRLEHFIAESPWAEGPVIEQVARDVDRLLGGRPESTLILDESGQPKKGRKSVGVARQWLGRLGKVDNGQVGVYASLSSDPGVSLVNARLFLPREWTDDPPRCEAAGVPPERIKEHRSKSELALEMVKQNRQWGQRFNWVGADSFYGADNAFLVGFEASGERFVVDIPKDRLVYREPPRPVVPPPSPGGGRPPRRLHAQSPGIRVDQLAAQQPPQAWQKLTIRWTTKEPLVVEVFHCRVWFWDGETAAGVYPWHLLVRREALSEGGYDYKYSLSNAEPATPVLTLAQQQARRFWVERTLEDAKGQAGMADYQVQGWRGWHHHMTLVMMTMLFLLEQRIQHRATDPLLSCRDLMLLLSRLLPRQDLTYEEILRQVEARHHMRQAAMASAQKRAQAKILAANSDSS
jgi:SRSO17 transposase